MVAVDLVLADVKAFGTILKPGIRFSRPTAAAAADSVEYTPMNLMSSSRPGSVRTC
jgi:hypothetical protein